MLFLFFCRHITFFLMLPECLISSHKLAFFPVANVFSKMDSHNKWLFRKIVNKKNDLLDQVVTHTRNTDITVSQAKNACDFAQTCSDEILVNFMNSIMETKNIPNIRKVHKHIANKVVTIVNSAQAQK